MNLQRGEDQTFVLEVTEDELRAVRAGLNETLNALDDWEFSIRTGVQREEMAALVDSLVEQQSALESEG